MAEVDPAFASNVDLETQEIILAAGNHDWDKLKQLLRNASAAPANVQDSETGFTPLHAAIDACEESAEDASPRPLPGTEAKLSNELTNGHDELSTRLSNSDTLDRDTGPRSNPLEAAAIPIVQLLLQHGAIWNLVDQKNETPGCVAKRLGLAKIYEIMVDAGVRSEILLKRLEEYQPLDDQESADNVNANATTVADESRSPPLTDGDGDGPRNENYLASRLAFGPEHLTDAERNGVMMAWEGDIMKRTADELLPRPGLRVLNIGHGMGIIDDFIQAKSPSEHHIIEAHPDVLQQMQTNGWTSKTNVTIHGARWQDVLPSLINEGQTFDAIYFDTFAEDYNAFRAFFEEYPLGLLDDSGRWSFFNGLGADRQICYDVYQKVVQMDLMECGWDVAWTSLPVPDLQREGAWEDVRRPYWKLSSYRLPVITYMG